MDIEEISKLFDVQCDKKHTHCKKINESLKLLIETKKYTPTVDFFDAYIYYMSKRFHKICLKTEETKECLFLMLKTTCPSLISLEYLIRCTYVIDILNQIMKYKYQLSDKLLDSAIILRKIKLVNILTKYENINITTKNLYRALSLCNMSIIQNIIARKIIPNKDIIEKAIIDFPNCVEYLIQFSDAKFDIKTLKKACSSINYDCIKLFLDM